MSELFNDIADRYLKRRQFLSAGATLAGIGLIGCGTRKDSSRPATLGSQPPGFAGMPHRLETFHSVAEGYRGEVLIRWGDSLGGQPPTRFPISSEEQRDRFGYNNDFIAYSPLDQQAANGTEHRASNNSQHGLLSINHENCYPHLMFPGFKNRFDAEGLTNDEQVKSSIYSVGHSVIEVEKINNQWRVIDNSPYQRRITPFTAIEITGPAAGSERLKTSKENTGRQVLGTLGNCAGGKTPWGTVLIAEENFSEFFGLDPAHIANIPDRELTNHRRFAVEEEGGFWARVDPRFDVTNEPHEMNRFGWMVEYNPYDPDSIPQKRTALGRFEHEGATLVCKEGQPVVAYSGDDAEHQYLYRFVSEKAYREGDHQHNQYLLESGTLYCAVFNEDGTGQWLPLLYGQGPLTAENGFYNQADVLIDTRLAAQLLGATKMDRPEDVETNPHTDRTYVALTKNKHKLSANAANPKVQNPAGHIVEILPPGVDGQRDHSQHYFSWDLLLLGGSDQTGAKPQGLYGGQLEEGGWFANPDNIAFDARGRLWIASDGCQSFGFADGLWCTATVGEERAKPRHFFSCPTGAELCGPEFTPDGKTLFAAVQHPATDYQSRYDQPSTRWPDFDAAIPPRPSIVAITKDNGGLIGD
ncbi:PhoX family protein [Oceanicoccus sagamiensis]|uniref:dTDP-glucose 4,6-dehydratase n=1 Tax=Oceanicoccus sagamiensis TaxID=716816 RepID=A0A1X9N7F6_9GAMM|nr:PhoX family phosphatase [Oceanicoccus sagamiensis]ARN74010.1 hypothetical protein BST96_07685 [Oceanicoccus sagamiensis]